MADSTWSLQLGGRSEADEATRGIGQGIVCLRSLPSPARAAAGAPNEDAVLTLDLGDGRAVFAVADGVGGMAVGDRASQAALSALCETVLAAVEAGHGLREGILAGFDAAQLAVPREAPGGATTLAVASIEGCSLRSYHAGDSLILVVGQRGRVRHRNVAHSPVGYAVEAGILDEDDALHHEDRHVISNAVGTKGLHIEVGPQIKLAPHDTLLLASDGLADNLLPNEIVELVRCGRLPLACQRLITLASERMVAPGGETPSKPDDLTLLAFRPSAHAHEIS